MAKLIVAAGVGILYGVVGVVVSIAIIVSWFAAEGVTIGWFENDLILVTLGVLLVIAVFAALGIGVGMLSDARCRPLDRRGSRL